MMTQDSNKMNQNKLKTYAPKARRDFIKAVTDREISSTVLQLGIEEQGTAGRQAFAQFGRTIGI